MESCSSVPNMVSLEGTKCLVLWGARIQCGKAEISVSAVSLSPFFSFSFLCFTSCIQPMYLGSTLFLVVMNYLLIKKIFITSNNLLLHWVTFLQILLQELLKIHYLYNQFQNLLFLFVHSLPITLLFMNLYLFGLILCLFFTKHW